MESKVCWESSSKKEVPAVPNNFKKPFKCESLLLHRGEKTLPECLSMRPAMYWKQCREVKDQELLREKRRTFQWNQSEINSTLKTSEQLCVLKGVDNCWSHDIGWTYSTRIEHWIGQKSVQDESLLLCFSKREQSKYSYKSYILISQLHFRVKTTASTIKVDTSHKMCEEHTF